MTILQLQRVWQLRWQHRSFILSAVTDPTGVSSRRTKLTPAERSLRARIAAYALHATHDPRDTTRPARDAFMARFERQVDPERRLPVVERQRRAEAAKKTYFSSLALKSAKARRAPRL